MKLSGLLAFLSIPALCFAPVALLQTPGVEIFLMPSAEILHERLNLHGFGDFAQSTFIVPQLANKKFIPLGIGTTVENVFGRYKHNMQKSNSPIPVEVTKPELYRLILLNLPAALEELEKLGLYRPLELNTEMPV